MALGHALDLFRSRRGNNNYFKLVEQDVWNGETIVYVVAFDDTNELSKRRAYANAVQVKRMHEPELASAIVTLRIWKVFSGCIKFSAISMQASFDAVCLKHGGMGRDHPTQCRLCQCR